MENDNLLIKPVAYIHTDFKEKFGIPRQSGLVKDLEADIVFCEEYRKPEALRCLEGFSHIWLIWEFSKAVRNTWSPTVRPPRLGGNKKVGVFATRSPFRPNPLGLSLVELKEIDLSSSNAPILKVSGADLLDGTPIYDIKPYIPYTDCITDAKSGFSDENSKYTLDVEIENSLINKVPENKRKALIGILSEDPHPSYQHDSNRIYGLCFAGMNIKFTVKNKLLKVTEVEKIE